MVYQCIPQLVPDVQMLIPPQFSHRNPPSRLVFGEGVIDRLADDLRELGVRRPVLVAGARTAASQVYARTRRALAGLDLAEQTGMPEHSPIDHVRRLCELARSHRADGFVAVGGGSASVSWRSMPPALCRQTSCTRLRYWPKSCPSSPFPPLFLPPR